ncbi:hypothetical protein ABT297_26270 [Dactylosporangium sp. NPDC000555]
MGGLCIVLAAVRAYAARRTVILVARRPVLLAAAGREIPLAPAGVL